MGGGKRNKPVVYDILVFENRQIFYLICHLRMQSLYIVFPLNCKQQALQIPDRDLAFQIRGA